MGNKKMTLILSVLLGIVACAGLQPSEETVNSVELKKHQISVGMTSEKVRELAGYPDEIVQGQHFDSASSTGVGAAPFTWWRYFGKSQDVNLKIDEAGYVKEIIVSRYAK